MLFTGFLALSVALNCWLLLFRVSPATREPHGASLAMQLMSDKNIAGIRFTDVETAVLNSTLSLRRSFRDVGRLNRLANN
jgi:hypothetical protein